MIDQTKKMKELIAVLNGAARAYYKENQETISNLEYDRLYDELAALEAETGVVLPDSPTVNVGYEVVDFLPKERHENRMLSLDKTKELETLKEWLGPQEGLLSWKLDGLTVVITYENGRLKKAVTRGTGEIGEVVTSNARVFANLPKEIPFQGELILRGEAVIRYSDFERINAGIPDEAARYKNPRNLCSGSVRQLSSRITAERSVRFYAFSLVKAGGESFVSRRAQMEWLTGQTFEVVEYEMVQQGNVEEAVHRFSERVTQKDEPSDGLVLAFDDIAYGSSLGSTAKFPRDAIAFKWRDELKETTLREIEWSASRTGLINPIAIFTPVELEGTTVSRASLHNVSIMRELELGIGDTITVYKANMIIPQIAENLTRSGGAPIPDECPVCGGRTEVQSENGIETLFCTNGECLAKHVKSITHFASRDAMNIEGLSEATIEKFIAAGILKEPADLFRLEDHREAIVSMEGFGEKSYRNLIAAANKARQTTTVRLLYALGIPNIGVSNAKAICKACEWDWEKIQNITLEELSGIYGIGSIMAEGFVAYFTDSRNSSRIGHILTEVEFESAPLEEGSQLLAGKIFVITGSLNHFENREALQATIEKNGGKTASSVTSKTGYLINNDNMSNSSKNKKAKELDVPVITEEEFMLWMENGTIPER